MMAQFKVVPTISEVQEFILPSRLLSPTFLYYSNPKYPDILYYDDSLSQLNILIHIGNAFAAQKKIISVHLITSLTVGNLNNDGLDDIVIVQRDQNKIILLLSRVSDSTYTSQTYDVNYYPEQVVIDDLDGDKIVDVISYGKLSSGISFLKGQGKNKFKKPIILFSSIPISNFSVINLNADRIPDVVVHNWLQNEDIFFIGLGKMRFSEQIALTYGDDSVKSTFGDFNSDGMSDAVVLSSQYRSAQVYHDSGLANVSLVQTLSLQEDIGSVNIIRFDEQKPPSILLTSSANNNFSFLVNKGDGSFYDEIIFGMPYQSNRLIISDINGDGYKDIVCFDDSSNHYTVFWNALAKIKSGNVQTIATGKFPSNIAVTDFNKDGLDDMLVSNEQSNTLSLLFGSKRNTISQFTIETTETPSSASLYSTNDTSLILVSAHQKTNKMGVITLTRTPNTPQSFGGDVESFTIPLPPFPFYVFNEGAINTSSISIFVFLSTAENPILLYQQLHGTKFVAKSLTPTLSSKILFATVSDINNDNHPDIAYLYTDTSATATFFGITLNDEKDDFTGKSFSYPISDIEKEQAFIYTDELNLDQRKEYILYLATTKRLFLLSISKDGTVFSNKLIIENLSLSKYEDLQIYDYNSDGINDLVYLDNNLNEIILLKGKGNNSFYFPKNILHLAGNSIFKCGDFNGDTKTDIAFAQQKGHTISISYGE